MTTSIPAGRRPRGRPRGRQGAELFDAARAVLLERGLAGTTMDAVAGAARVSKASLYQQFGSKDGLYEATVADWVARGRDAMRPVAEALLDAPDLPEALGRFARTLQTAVLGEDVTRMRSLVTSEAARRPEVAALYLADSWERNIAALAGVLAELAERGRLAIDDPATAAEQFTWLCLGAPLNRRSLGASSDPQELDRVAAAAVATFLARFGKISQ